MAASIPCAPGDFRAPGPLTCKDAGLGIKAAGRGRNPHPLELKVMGVLRVLGRSVCFDDLEDSTFIARADGSVCYGRLKHSSPRG